MHPFRLAHAAAVCLAAAFLLACGGEPSFEARLDPSSLRETPSGEVMGFTGPYGSHVWRGLPYAEPPVGERRWRAPRPAPAWSGTRSALQHGNWCPQLGSPLVGDDSVPAGTPVGDEDCLYLDLYAPRFTPDAVPRGRDALPVMVWLHGGGNVVGSAAFYDGGRLAADQNVIVVAINYRLGPFGWLRHRSLRGAGTTPADRSGNFGNLDQIRALEWVRDHIAAFGGDPGRVTVFGESAGGRDTFALLVSPRARGLFHRAIVQSGGTETLPAEVGENWSDAAVPGHANSSNEVLARLLVAEGRAADADAARAELAGLRDTEVADFLRGIEPADLLAAYRTEAMEGLIDVPTLFRDGAVLPRRDPLEHLADGGGHNQVPVMLGTTRDENRIFLFTDPRYVQWLLGLVPRVREPEVFYASGDTLSSMWKATGADEPAALLRGLQGRSVYVYRFDWDEAPTLLYLADLGQMLGASHGFDIPFVFGHWYLGRQARVLFSEGNRAGREELSAAMRSYWAEFARTGDPASGRDGNLPRWQPWEPGPDAEKFLALDTREDGGIRMLNDVASREEVLASVETDTRLASQRERCAVYSQLASFGRGFDRADYPRAGAQGCLDFPLGGYPWNGD